MSKNNGSSASGGIGFFGVLGIVFIVLKLMGIISWSWGWVLFPIWGSILVGSIIVLAVWIWASRF